MSSLVWIDVDGTAETGDASSAHHIEQNMTGVEPLGRAYNYNFPLFEALKRQGLTQVQLFTAYSAASVSGFSVMRCELLDWASAQGFIVAYVATPLDVMYALYRPQDDTFAEDDELRRGDRGPGCYYRDVIEPCERALVASGNQKLELDHVVRILGENWSFERVLLFERRLQETFRSRHGSVQLNKGRMAEFCLSHTRCTSLLFFDDNAEFIRQVQSSAQSMGVSNVCCVLVNTQQMTTVAQYCAEIRKLRRRSSCVIS